MSYLVKSFLPTAALLCILFFIPNIFLFSQAEQLPEQDWKQLNSALLSDLTSGGVGVNSSILNALGLVPRHRFTDASFVDIAYNDIPVPAFDSSILPSPTDVLHAVELLAPVASDNILVIGNNAGYTAAVLSRLSNHVYLIEETSAASDYPGIFSNLGFDNISVAQAADINSFSEIIAFNRILIHGSASEISERLTERLSIQGNITFVLAVQGGFQQLVSLRRSLLGDSIETGGSCYFPEIKKLKISN